MGRPPCSEKSSELKRGPWTQEEDQKLMEYISKNGHGNWRTLPKNAGLSRCGKSCRLRWTNYLRPDIKRGRFSMEEEYTIIHLHSLLGNKWSAIASHLPGRTDNEIKNYWNTHIRKRLTRMGIDPVTHTLRLDLLDQALSNPALQLNRDIYRSSLSNLDAELLMLANSLTSATQYNQNINMLDNSFNPHQNLQEIPNLDMGAVEDQPQMQVPSYCTQMGLDGYDQFVGDQLISNNHNLFIQDGVVGSDGVPSMQNCNFASGIPSNTTATTTITTTLPDLGGQFDQMDPTLYDCPLPTTTSCSQNFHFASVLSTPASSPSTNLNSTSTFINSSIAEDDRDSFCSSDLSFQVQQVLEANDFL